MKVSDVTILMVPGYLNSGPDHWQTRWEQKLSSAERVEQEQWSKPVLEDWTFAVTKAVNAAQKPVLFIAHSLGIPTVIHALPNFKQRVAGAFFVAPPDVANCNIKPKHLMTFGPYPRAVLPFPTLLVASRNDELCNFEIARDLANSWGAVFVDAGQSGHVNSESGHGPWPEGTMTFAKFISDLKNVV
jgi:uncharacterized protein